MINLKEIKIKLDALINKSHDVSDNLEPSEKNEIIRKVIYESIDKAIINLKLENSNLNRNELDNKEREIRDFIEMYLREKGI